MPFLSQPGSETVRPTCEVHRLRAPGGLAQRSTRLTAGNGTPNLCSTPPWGGFFTNAGGMRKRRPPDRRMLPYHKFAEFQSGAQPLRQEPLPGFSEKYFSNLPVSRSYWAASAGGVPLAVMLGHSFE